MTTFRRFANLDDMIAFAVAHAISADSLVYVSDVVVYSDDKISYRPSLVLSQRGHEDINLRWNAHCDRPDVDHIGKHARIEARDQGGWFQDQVQNAINTAIRTRPHF